MQSKGDSLNQGEEYLTWVQQKIADPATTDEELEEISYEFLKRVHGVASLSEAFREAARQEGIDL